jgi:hypothetical protein
MRQADVVMSIAGMACSGSDSTSGAGMSACRYFHGRNCEGLSVLNRQRWRSPLSSGYPLPHWITKLLRRLRLPSGGKSEFTVLFLESLGISRRRAHRRPNDHNVFWAPNSRLGFVRAFPRPVVLIPETTSR